MTKEGNKADVKDRHLNEMPPEVLLRILLEASTPEESSGDGVRSLSSPYRPQPRFRGRPFHDIKPTQRDVAARQVCRAWRRHFDSSILTHRMTLPLNAVGKLTLSRFSGLVELDLSSVDMLRFKLHDLHGMVAAAPDHSPACCPGAPSQELHVYPAPMPCLRGLTIARQRGQLQLALLIGGHLQRLTVRHYWQQARFHDWNHSYEADDLLSAVLIVTASTLEELSCERFQPAAECSTSSLRACSKLRSLRLWGYSSSSVGYQSVVVTAHKDDQPPPWPHLTSLAVSHCTGVLDLATVLAWRGSSLAKLEVKAVDLIDFPPHLPSSLTAIRFHQCALTTVPRNLLNPCTALATVNLAAMRLSELPLAVCTPQLTALDVSGNPMRSLPAAIGDCARLLSLRLMDTGLQELPAQMSHCTALELLNLSHCSRMNHLPDWLAHLPALRNLSLASFRGDAPWGLLGQMTGLTYLQIDDVEPRSPPPSPPLTLDMLHLLTKLRVLRADHAALASLNGIGALTALEQLSISSNKLSSLEDLGTLTHLKVLSASLQQGDDGLDCLSSIPGSLPGSLEYLRLNANHPGVLSARVFTPELLSGLTALRGLGLAGQICREEVEALLKKLRPGCSTLVVNEWERNLGAEGEPWLFEGQDAGSVGESEMEFDIGSEHDYYNGDGEEDDDVVPEDGEYHGYEEFVEQHYDGYDSISD